MLGADTLVRLLNEDGPGGVETSVSVAEFLRAVTRHFRGVRVAARRWRGTGGRTQLGGVETATTDGGLRTPPEAPALYWFAERTVGSLVRRFYRLGLDGVERVPSRGPVILAPNHRSFMDSIFLCTATARPVSFVAKAEYFDRRLTR